MRRGDAEAALASATYSASAQIDTTWVEHAYIESEAGTAWPEGDGVAIRACTQAPMMDRDETARILGLPPEAVRIVPAATGGGFGSKLDVSLQPLIGLAALKTGRPCRMVFSRAESMASTTKRHPGQMRATIGTDAGGRITAMTFDGTFDTGAYASWGPTVANRVPVHASGPYRTPNYRAEARAIHTNGPMAGAFRGFGVPQAAILQETIYDELAAKAGLDRLAFRRLNALAEGETSVCGQVMKGVGIAACLDALLPEWKAAQDRARRVNGAGGRIRRGIGVASCWYGCGNTALPNPSTIKIGLTARGRVRLHQGAVDIGQGSNTVIAQIAADALGLPLADIDLVDADTAVTPDAGKTSASRQTVVTGNAALRAARALRAKILALANLGPVAELSLKSGILTVAGDDGNRRIALAELPADGEGFVLRAEETYDPPTSALDENGQGVPYAVYGYGAQLAEVEVDCELGTVRVRRITAAHDLGRVINPLLAEGQIEGGIAQGLGMALMEDFVPGRTENLHDYLIPTVGDMPKITTILIEVPDPEGPMGAKGLGEHALIPTAPAILNAIADATGARITRLPALPHRVLAAIRAARGGDDTAG
ncbi:MAG: molybdopterin cofactor-binding domain-containing protein [Paracoccaceae bacterium]